MTTGVKNTERGKASSREGRVFRQGPWWTQLSPRQGALVFAVEALLLLALWQFLVGGLEIVNPVFLPPPMDTVAGFFTLAEQGELAGNVVASVTSWLIGYGLAVGFGVVTGLTVGTSVAANRMTSPILWSIYATPWLAYRPLTVAWFGFGRGPIIFLVFIAAVFPILLNTAAGIRTTDRTLLNAGRIFGAGRLELFRKILLPSTLPFILTGMRQGAVMGTIALTVAELTGSAKGLGALIIFKANSFKTAESFAAIALVVLWSVTMSQSIRLLSRWLAPWTSGEPKA